MQDRTQGIFLQNDTSSQIAVADNAFVWLDAIKLPNATNLALRSDSNHTRYISLREVPHLERITNANALPLVVHVDASDKLTALHIEGPIEHVDICWHGGGYTHSCASASSQVLLLPVHEVDSHRELIGRFDAQALIILFAIDGYPGPTELSLSTHAQVVVYQLAELKQLSFTGERTALVEIKNCQALAVVTGAGECIQLYASGGQELLISGNWREVALTSCRSKGLTIEAAATLYIRGHCAIASVHLPELLMVVNESPGWFIEGGLPEVNESTLLGLQNSLTSLTANDKAAEASLVEKLLGAVRQCSRPKSLYHAICLLSLMAEKLPHYHEEILQARRDLAKQANRWQFERDRETDAWVADLELWHWFIAHNQQSANTFYLNLLTQHKLAQPAQYALVTVSLKFQNELILQRVIRTYNKALITESKLLLPAMKGVQERLWLAFSSLSKKTQLLLCKYFLISVAKEELHLAGAKLLQIAPHETRITAMHLANLIPERKALYLAVAFSAVAPSASEAALTWVTKPTVKKPEKCQHLENNWLENLQWS